MIKNIFTGLAVLLSVLVLNAPAPAYAAIDADAAKQQACKGAALNDGASCDPAAGAGLRGTLRTAFNILSIIVGVVAVIMVIVGGFKFITSGGDSSNVASARNTILYALIGLGIAALAQIIARFALSRIAS